MTVGKILENFANITTLHGAPHIIRAKYCFVRLSWAMIFLGASAMFGFQLSQLFVKYYNYEKHTSIEICLLNESELPWITICFPQTFDSLVLRQIFDLFRYNRMERQRIIKLVKSNNRNKFIDFFNTFYDHFTVGGVNYVGFFFRDVFYDLDRTAMEEGMMKIDFNSNKNENFYVIKRLYFPNPCYTLQFKKNLAYRRKRYNFQLKIISGHTLKPTEDERRKAPAVIRHLFDSLMIQSHINIYIHQPNSDAFGMKSQYFSVSYKNYASLVINTRKMERLGYPYGYCTSAYPYKYHSKGNYIQSVCNAYLGLNKFIDEYNCKFSFMQIMELKHVNELPYCSPFGKSFMLANISKTAVEAVIAANDNMTKFGPAILSELPGDIASICPRSCDEFNYDVDMKFKHIYNDLLLDKFFKAFLYNLILSNDTTRLRLYGMNVTNVEPGKIFSSYDDVQLSNISVERLLEELSIVEFEMKTDDMIVTKENPGYTFVQLLSDIGGQLGLWIGMSVVTVFELLDLLYEFSKTICTKCRNKKRHTFVEFQLNDISVIPRPTQQTAFHEES